MTQASRTLVFSGRTDRPSRPATPGFASRLIAYLIDLFTMALACMFTTSAISLTVRFFQLRRFTVSADMVNVATRVAILLIVSLYLPLSWALTGQSIGKALLGLRIVRARHPERSLGFTRCFFRFVCYWLSSLPLGLGFLWAIVDEEHRALHDRLAGTRVVYQTPRRPF